MSIFFKGSQKAHREIVKLRAGMTPEEIRKDKWIEVGITLLPFAVVYSVLGLVRLAMYLIEGR